MAVMLTMDRRRTKNDTNMKPKLQLAVALLFFTGSLTFSQNNSIIIKTQDGKDTISRYIYGQFAEHLGRCIYDGIWVGENSSIPNTRGIRNDVVAALKEINVPVLRWPGGCFADTYHWKEGIGPKDKRPPMINMFWGGVTEDNNFGTHEFLDLCGQLGAEPYLAVNVGSGTVEDAADWIEYVNSDKDSPMTRLRKENGRSTPWDVKFWGIGNENWGCGGNMDASFYADLYKKFSTYCWVDYKVASGGLNDDPNWTETIMSKTMHQQQLIQGYSYHHYTVCHTWEHKGSAVNFDEKEWFLTVSKNMEMEKNLMQHIAIMDKYDPEKKIGLMADEWGNWYDPEPGSDMGLLYQQNTLRDAITASIYLNVFNNHCDRVKMANIAQVVNVLQSMLLTQGDKLVKTPSFYVFKMYNVHHDALMLPLEITSENYSSGDQSIPTLSASASKNRNGEINVTVANVNPSKVANTLLLLDTKVQFDVVKAEVITAEQMNALNDFDKNEAVNIREFKNYKLKGTELTAELPAKSVVLLTLKTK
jgi:alpha-N-arabinofuranosidase